MAGCSGQNTTDTSSGGNGVFDEVAKTFTGPTGKHKVTYEVDYGDGNMVKTTTYYLNENKIRIDLTSAGETTKTYSVDGTITMCTKQGDSFTCLTISPTDINNPASDIEYNFPEDNIKESGYILSRDGTITVSEHTAKCYKASYGETIQRYCFSDENVMLYTKTITEEGDIVIFEAKEYSTDVSETDFLLPSGAEVVDLGKELQDLQNDLGNGVGGDTTAGMEALGECYSGCDAQYGSDTEALEGCYGSCLG
ncbi:TPA: hypothetical protein HA219_01385 [Candidatus Woesearchaeota archaeon]|nr:hypothetical protein [Candidatus Woesearchaeota archaeon]